MCNKKKKVRDASRARFDHLACVIIPLAEYVKVSIRSCYVLTVTPKAFIRSYYVLTVTNRDVTYIRKRTYGVRLSYRIAIRLLRYITNGPIIKIT